MKNGAQERNLPKLGLVLLVICFTATPGESSVAAECTKNVTGRTEKILARIFTNYDSQVSPSSNYETYTVVDVQLALQSIHAISETGMDFELLLYIRQAWYDRRLRYDKDVDEDVPHRVSPNPNNKGDEDEDEEVPHRVSLNPNHKGKLWVPDLFITNEKDSKLHTVTVPNELILIHKDGKVMTSTRVSVKAACPMELHNFPHDIQDCMLGLESFGYTTEDLVFKWNNEPVANVHTVNLPHFKLLNHRTEDCTKYYPHGNFTCVAVFFTFERQIQYYLIHVFIPSVLIVVLSWVNFWIDVGAAPARVSVGLLTVLTLTTQSGSARGYMPKVSYVKASDVWMAVCLIFVVLGLLEYAWANVLARREKKMEARDTLESRVRLDNLWLTAQRLDRVSRLVFPISFIVFNVLYWFVYEFSETTGKFS